MGTTLDSSLPERHSSWHIVGTYNRFFLSEHSWDSMGHRHMGASAFVAALHGQLSFPENNVSNQYGCFQRTCFFTLFYWILSRPWRHSVVLTSGSQVKAGGLQKYKTSMAVSGPTCPICLCSTGHGWKPDFWAIHAWGHLAEHKVAEAGRGGWLCARPMGLGAFNNWFLLTI